MTRPTRGFSLLEVMVAVAILGLSLTMILSAQAGLFASTKHAQRVSVGTGLVRCRMAEIELQLMKDGFPLMDQTDDGPCCDTQETDEFFCRWRIERIELPQPASIDDPAAAGSASAGPPGMGDLSAIASAAGNMGPGADLAAVGALSQMQGSSGDGDPMSGLAGGLAGAGGGGIIATLLGMVYPSFKPMLEESIRKVTVDLVWREGVNEKGFSVVQYLTYPQQGGFDEQAADGMTKALDAQEDKE